MIGGDIKRENDFHQALGEALAAWQWVEGAAFAIYAAFMRGAKRQLVSVSFHHIQSFDSRIQLLDRCAYFILPKGSVLSAKWVSLKKRLEGFTKQRNQIVHFAYIIEGGGSGGRVPTLAPSHMNATFAISDRYKNPDFRYDTYRLQKLGYDFERFSRDELSPFLDELKALLDKSPTPKRSARKVSDRQRQNISSRSKGR